MSTHPEDREREDRLREMEREEQETERIQERADFLVAEYHMSSDEAARTARVETATGELWEEQETERMQEGALCPDCGFTHPDTAHRPEQETERIQDGEPFRFSDNLFPPTPEDQRRMWAMVQEGERRLRERDE